MKDMTTLTDALIDIVEAAAGKEAELIVGGGFGIYLRYKALLRNPQQTLLTELPEPRSTNDLDLFLRAELIMDTNRLKVFAETLNTLGYEAVETARFYQFVKRGPRGGEAGSVKLDILTGPQEVFKARGHRTDERRVRSKPPIDLHAHPVEEALTLEEGLQSVPVEGSAIRGTTRTAQVSLPHPFTFLMMKLFAFRDNLGNPEKDYGRHHALDIYTTVAMMTRTDWDSSLAICSAHRDAGKVVEARGLVCELFAHETAKGIIRLKENKYYRPSFQLADFMKALKDLFAEPEQ